MQKDLLNKIMNKRIIKKVISHDTYTRDCLRVVEPRTDPENALAATWGKRMEIIVVLLAVAVLLFIYCFTEETESGYLTSPNTLSRPESEKDVELFVEGDSTEGRWKQKLDISLGERDFTKEEIKILDERVESFAGSELLGENTSTEHIDKDLKFVSGIPETGITLKWTTQEKYVDETGHLLRSSIPGDGIDTEVMLEAKWRNFDETYHFLLHLDPPKYTVTELAKQSARKEIREAVKEQSESEEITLPEAYSYSEEEQKKSYLPVWLVLIVMLALPLVWREGLKKRITKREEQLLLDHPGFINKIMLLLGAGLTLRKAVERLTDEYERKRSEGGELHYIYEELCITAQEMRDGQSEVQAMENFGRRSRSMPYMRFASVITQNLKKGSEGILALLEKEASDSLIERKQSALRMGEVAGTKLLFPMMIMLGLVMGIIMVPAFMTM